MTTKKKTRAELEAENTLLKKQRRSGEISLVLITLIKWGGIVGMSYCGYLSINSLSGKQTEANIGIGFLFGLSLKDVITYLLALIFGLGGSIYGLAQKYLRQQTIERLQERNMMLEKSLDPNRTSSGLTPQGKTNPEDK